MLRPIHLRSLWLISILGFGIASQAFAQGSAEKGQGHAVSPGSDRPAVEVYSHSVKLSWGPSTPATKMARDAVVGYNVYRSTATHDRNPKRINSKPCAGTTYIDNEVEAGKTYFYVTRGVTAKGVESHPSNEVKVVTPPL